MKFIFILSRILSVLFIWTIGYFFWFQRLMMAMWGFNPLSKKHWIYIWNQWQAGWVIQSFREWMFVLVLFAMIPVWFTGWAVLCTVPWMKWFKIILMFPIKLIKSKIKERQKERNAVKPKVTKRKSYKKTRPAAIRAGSGKIKPPVEKVSEKTEEKTEENTKETAHQSSSRPKKQETGAQKNVSTQKSAAAGTGSIGGGTIMNVLRSAGYRLISDAKIGGKKIDFVGVSANNILLCLVDSETGDWLADEERFNDEEPLWFSESNHRISPVRNILNARDALLPTLTGEARGLEIKPMVVIRQGTIINAEDMFEVWNGLNVTVCRFDEGGPEEIASLQNSIQTVDGCNEGLYHTVSGLFN